jgi:hypothetical protein
VRGRRAPLARVVASLVAIVALAAATPTGAEAAASAPNAPAATPAARPGAASRDARSVEAMPAAGVTAALGDPLASAECQRALAVLKEEEAAVAEWSRASGGVTTDERRLIDARLAPARRNAARSCLARRADPPTLASERLVRPAPITTPPFAVRRPRSRRPRSLSRRHRARRRRQRPRAPRRSRRPPHRPRGPMRSRRAIPAAAGPTTARA